MQLFAASPQSMKTLKRVNAGDKWILQAGSSARLVATAIGRCSSEGQPLVALDCQPSLPRGAEELFCDSLRTSWIHAGCRFFCENKSN